MTTDSRFDKDNKHIADDLRAIDAEVLKYSPAYVLSSIKRAIDALDTQPSSSAPMSQVSDPTNWNPTEEFNGLEFTSYTDAKKAEVLFNRLIRERDAALATRSAIEEKETVLVSDIEAEIAHIKDNGGRVKALPGMFDEGRCRELCAMYLSEFISNMRLGKKLAAIRSAVRTEIAAPWVSVHDRLPDPNRIVWVAGLHALQTCAHFDGAAFLAYDEDGEDWRHNINGQVTHWMPLPPHPLLKQRAEEQQK